MNSNNLVKDNVTNKIFAYKSLSHTHTNTHIHIFFFFIIQRVKSTCDTLTSSATNQGDNTVSVAQGSTATPRTTKQLLPPDRVFKRNIYLYIRQIN